MTTQAIGTFLLALLVANFIAIQLTTIYLHRAMTHDSVRFPQWFKSLAKVLVWMHTSIVTKRWVGVHRQHHANADVEGDPHSPSIFGFWPVQIWNVRLYGIATKDVTMVERHTRDIPYTTLDRAFFNYGPLGLVVGGGTYLLIFGWAGLLGFVVSGLCYVFLQSSTINGLGHHPSKIGHRNHEGEHAAQSYNLRWPGKLQWILTWFLGGEENHNNHHHSPGSAKFSHEPKHGEVDLGWQVIRLLKLLGIAEVKRA
jgi:stearoyl-CoA desaturase (Delta-9 desaturase)